MNKNYTYDNVIEYIEEDVTDVDEVKGEEGEEGEYDPADQKLLGFDTSAPINGSPIYPRIYTGDSARELYNDTEYKRVSETWIPLINSFYG